LLLTKISESFEDPESNNKLSRGTNKFPSFKIKNQGVAVFGPRALKSFRQDDVVAEEEEFSCAASPNVKKEILSSTRLDEIQQVTRNIIMLNKGENSFNSMDSQNFAMKSFAKVEH
jgi:ferredoxin-fold anticodon binding domain-containing protein